MFRFIKPDQFQPGAALAGHKPKECHEHGSIPAFIWDLGTQGAPGRTQSPWEWIVESDETGTWKRIGRVLKHHDHRTEYIADPVPQPAA